MWVLAINSLAVFIAMGCVIQFYYQLKESLAEHKPFTKVLAIKLVVFLAFWQTTCISLGTSTLNVFHANEVLAYPDIKVGIPALLLCFEMAIFSVFHLWAFPYAPYKPNAKPTFYPVPDVRKSEPYLENAQIPPSGGFLGLAAIWDAMNLWDIVKAFGRGMRWLFCGVKRRKEDISYKNNLDLDNLHNKDGSSYDAMRPGAKSTDHLPIATEFRRSTFGMGGYQRVQRGDEGSSLIEHAQPNPETGLAVTTNSPHRIQTNTPWQPANEHSQHQDPYIDSPQKTSAPPFPFPEAGSSNRPPRPEVQTNQPPRPQTSHRSPTSPQNTHSPPSREQYGQRTGDQEAMYGQKFI